MRLEGGEAGPGEGAGDWEDAKRCRGECGAIWGSAGDLIDDDPASLCEGEAGPGREKDRLDLPGGCDRLLAFEDDVEWNDALPVLRAAACLGGSRARASTSEDGSAGSETPAPELPRPDEGELPARLATEPPPEPEPEPERWPWPWPSRNWSTCGDDGGLPSGLSGISTWRVTNIVGRGPISPLPSTSSSRLRSRTARPERKRERFADDELRAWKLVAGSRADDDDWRGEDRGAALGAAKRRLGGACFSS